MTTIQTTTSGVVAELNGLYYTEARDAPEWDVLCLARVYDPRYLRDASALARASDTSRDNPLLRAKLVSVVVTTTWQTLG